MRWYQPIGVPHFCGPSVAFLALFYLALDATGAYAQNTTGIVPLVTNDPVAEYLTKGGAFAVILVILFFYRRDWKTAVEFWQNQHQITTDLVEKATRAQADNSAALRENSSVLQRLTDKLNVPRA